MSNYSYIGYTPDVISISFFNPTFNPTVTLAADFDAATDRRIFNVKDQPSPPDLVNGDPDNGTDFNGDRLNDEGGDDLTQFGDVTDIDGNPVPGLTPGGNIYLETSYILTGPSGDTVTLFEVEVNGVLAGYIVSEPLVPGVDYSFGFGDIVNITPDNAPDTTDPDALEDVPCFVQGTMIRTPKGDRRVETLTTGDEVLTADGHVETIRWVGARHVNVWRADKRHLMPVRIAKGALGNGAPTKDLFVSPNHRMLVSSPMSQLLFEDAGVLIPAKFLLTLPGVDVVAEALSVTYYHFIFDQHEVVISNGTPSESLFPGDVAMGAMENASRSELLEIFPELFDRTQGSYGPTAARVLRKHEAQLLVAQYH